MKGDSIPFGGCGVEPAKSIGDQRREDQAKQQTNGAQESASADQGCESVAPASVTLAQQVAALEYTNIKLRVAVRNLAIDLEREKSMKWGVELKEDYEKRGQVIDEMSKAIARQVDQIDKLQRTIVLATAESNDRLTTIYAQARNLEKFRLLYNQMRGL